MPMQKLKPIEERDPYAAAVLDAFDRQTKETLNTEQRAILEHTANRAAGGLYCGDSPDMQVLVANGLMEYAGRKSFVTDPYFRITAAGREALRA